MDLINRTIDHHALEKARKRLKEKFVVNNTYPIQFLAQLDEDRKCSFCHKQWYKNKSAGQVAILTIGDWFDGDVYIACVDQETCNFRAAVRT